MSTKYFAVSIVLFTLAVVAGGLRTVTEDDFYLAVQFFLTGSGWTLIVLSISDSLGRKTFPSREGN